MTDVIDSTAVEETGAELAPVQPANLFRGDSPAQVLERARETAEAFKPVVESHSVNVGGRSHIQVEGWLTLGAMLGVTPVCTWTRKFENGWEARVEARTLDGRVVGAAEAECLRAEENWKDSDDFAIRSMAQTRATSKALASVLRFVATLAGAEGTPAEEMPRDGGGSGAPSEKQIAFMDRLLTEGGAPAEARQAVLAYAQANLKGGRGGSCSQAIDKLKDDDGAYFRELLATATSWQQDVSDLPEPDERDLADEPVGAAPDELQL